MLGFDAWCRGRGEQTVPARPEAIAAFLKDRGEKGAAYNFGRRLKTLKGLTPYEPICKTWQREPARFTSNPHHQIPGSNI